jgi:hypothetical protein
MTIKRYAFIFGVTSLLLSCFSCASIVGTPKSPDQILYDRGMDAIEQKKTDVACLTFRTLMNSYPDSEYVSLVRPVTDQSWCSESQGFNDYGKFF